MGTQAFRTSVQASDDTGDPLGEIDEIMAGLTASSLAADERSAKVLDDRRLFVDEFKQRCTDDVRPAMEAVLDRLRRNGGGGLVEEHPGGEPRVSTPRLTAWLSPVGEITGTPRPDRLPYLQLDADVNERKVRVTEGDVWGPGDRGHSGSGGTWKLDDLTGATVTRELLDILRRVAGA
jgi:hypothetical protein